MTFRTDPAEAARVSGRLRTEKAALKQALRNQTVDWRDILNDPPDCIADLWITDFLLLVPTLGRYRVQTVTRDAWKAGVNLVVPVGRASPLTRKWLVEHTATKAAGRALVGHGRTVHRSVSA